MIKQALLTTLTGKEGGFLFIGACANQGVVQSVKTELIAVI